MADLTLILVRHAKAEQGGPDAERALSARGRRDAAAAGAWLAAHDLLPDLAVVSSARRAVQTWELIAAAADPAPATTVDDRIYENTVEDLLDVVHDLPTDVRRAALVGHNPAFERLAVELDDGSGDPDLRAELEAGLPTSGIAVFDVATPFAELDLGSAVLTGFAVPRG